MRMLLLCLLSMFLVASCGDDDPRGTDAGPGTVDAGGGGTDAGPGDVDAGPGDVDAGAAGDTWATTMMALFDRYCVDHHAGAPSGRDYRTIDDVRRDGPRIRCGVTPASEPLADCSPPMDPGAGQFPAGAPFPSDEERRRIVAWIDDGLPE